MWRKQLYTLDPNAPFSSASRPANSKMLAVASVVGEDYNFAEFRRFGVAREFCCCQHKTLTVRGEAKT